MHTNIIAFPDGEPAAGAHDAAYFARHLPRELARSQRHGHFLAVLDCDIHGFLEAKECFGQEAADSWLNEFVSRAWGRIRHGDWMARSGEHGFMFVLPETNAKGAHFVADKLRRLIALHPLVTPVALINFSMEVGVIALEAHRDADCAHRVNALLRKIDCRKSAAERHEGAHGRHPLN